MSVLHDIYQILKFHFSYGREASPILAKYWFIQSATFFLPFTVNPSDTLIDSGSPWLLLLSRHSLIIVQVFFEDHSASRNSFSKWIFFAHLQSCKMIFIRFECSFIIWCGRIYIFSVWGSLSSTIINDFGGSLVPFEDLHPGGSSMAFGWSLIFYI